MNTTRCDFCGVLAKLDYYEELGWLCFRCHEKHREIERNWEETEEDLNTLS